MITKNLINVLSEDTESFIALTGCKISNISYQCCEYDIIIIDRKTENSIINDPINGLIEIYRINYESFKKSANESNFKWTFQPITKYNENH